jgi:hypothetical protein
MTPESLCVAKLASAPGAWPATCGAFVVADKRRIATVDPFEPLLAGIVTLLEESRRAAGRAINSILTSAYWEIGRRIVEEEQRGRRKANYGDQLVEQLAADLTARFGKGFSRTNVFQMRQFYLAFREIVQAVCTILSGSNGPDSAVQAAADFLESIVREIIARLSGPAMRATSIEFR